ncbi:MAG TPA: DUF4347 domain-containing protein [Rhodopila sp.]|nr:DUF4347 domain-containing protein [Rhodopila sp.]
MTERVERRQLGVAAHRQDASDDGIWTFTAGVFGGSQPDINLGQPILPPQAAPPSLAQYRQIVFIEGDVPDARQLAAGVSPGTLAVILNPNADGVDQIAAFLAAYDISNLAGIDIVAHGADATVQLGTGTLSTDSLSQYQAQLATIGAALLPGGDIEIFGCDVAQDAAGVAFLDQLSAATGGANVAAASHLVGASAGGGSWDLDVNTGSIAVGSPFTAAAEAAYPAELAVAATAELYVGFNPTYGLYAGSIVAMAVHGSTAATGVTTVGTNGVLANNSSTNQAPAITAIVLEAPQGKYYVIDDSIVASDDGSADEILVGTFGSTALATPGSLDFSSSTSIELWGMAESSTPNILYITNEDNDDPNENGIWQVNVTNGSVSPVAVSSSVYAPDDLAIDEVNNLGFFSDSNTSTGGTNLDVGDLSTGNVQVLSTELSGDYIYGVAVYSTAVNSGTVYFDSGYNGYLSGVYDATYTLAGGKVTLTGTHTLYTILAGGSVSPMGLAIDPEAGVFYLGNDDGNAYPDYMVWEGSLAGSTTAQPNLTAVYTSASSASPYTDGLAVETVPLITASGILAYTRGQAASVLDSGATATNPDNEGLASATVTIANFATGDTLSAITSGTSITAAYSDGTLTLTTGTTGDTAAHFQQVLDSVKFSTTGAVGTRTIDWTTSDGQISSATATSSVTVASGETVTAGATATFTGGAAAVTLDSGLTISDSASTTLVSATVAIGGYITGDTLTVGTPGGLASSFNNGTLTLNGSASIATYQTALRSITYSFTPSNGDPTGGGSHTSRTISWTVNDGGATSTAVTSTVTEVHVAPTLTTTGTVTYTGPSPIALDTAITVLDIDSGGTLSGATIRIGAGFTNGDTLVFSAQNGITGNYATTTGTLALSGSASIVDYQAALESIKFITTNASLAARTIDWSVTDGAASSATTTSTVDVICFCAGTLIRTPNGDVSVETLKPGDMVSTAHNGPREIRWIGKGKVLATRNRRSAATPVIVRKSALADNVPHQDLRVTKAHSLYIDGVLIPVEFLVNHRTILWDDRAQEVEIYHVELSTHDVLIANGAPAESYRDDGNRWLFENANPAWESPPQPPYAPVLTGGPQVDAIWRQLLDRAGPRNLPPLTDDPDLHLIVDGMRIDARKRRGLTYVFDLPARPASVIIASRSAVPSELGLARDPRPLGVALRRVEILQGAQYMLLVADDQRLAAGFHGYEPTDHLRWTDGYAELPIDAFVRFSKGAAMILHLGGTTHYLETGPAQQAA